MVIAADGRRSTIAIGRGLSRQPQRPRRWAIGAYFAGVEGVTTFGEMHVRRGHYIGVAPVPGGLTNACVVVPHPPSRRRFGGTAIMAIGRSPCPRKRSIDISRRIRNCPRASPTRARSTPPTMLGPMAVDTTAVGEPGLLLAGDAAGFIDPMTGDGLSFALTGAELAAAIVKEVLDGSLPIDRAHLELAARRRRGLSIEVALQSRVAVARLVAFERHGGRGDGEGVAIALQPNDPLCR